MPAEAVCLMSAASVHRRLLFATALCLYAIVFAAFWLFEGLPVSFGWAAAPEDGVGPLELFRKADDRLYAAKLIARNHRVVEQLAAARH
jgi:GGDEF domain-containing protein